MMLNLKCTSASHPSIPAYDRGPTGNLWPLALRAQSERLCEFVNDY